MKIRITKEYEIPDESDCATCDQKRCVGGGAFSVRMCSVYGQVLESRYNDDGRINGCRPCPECLAAREQAKEKA